MTLIFDNEALARMEGVQLAEAETTGAPPTPDAKAIYKQQKKEKNEDERAQEPTESGVVITPAPPTP